MQTRPYKDTGKQISLLGFGAMRMPCLDKKNVVIDVPASTEIVDFALANGVNYFDTAYMYHGGTSESVLGEILSRHPRESFYLADKMPPWPVKCEADVHRIFEEQLKRCKVDYFDFYLIHNVSSYTMGTIRSNRIYEILREKQAEGKIRHLGFSFHDKPEVLDEYTKEFHFDFTQIQLNYLDWEIQDAKSQYEILAGRGIPVIVMEPVRGGALHALAPKAVDIFKAANPKVSPASWALRFAASLPGVMTVLSGMSSLDQMKDNIETMSNFAPLTDDERKVIDKALTEYRLGSPIPCTACRYCMDCPAGVEIPQIFAYYNNYLGGGRPIAFLNDIGVLGEKGQPHSCTGCGACLSKCPQHIEIPSKMAEVANAVDKLNK